MESEKQLRVCWVDTMRYTRPLSASQAKKWRRLTQDLGVNITVISFSPHLRPQRFDEYAHFYQWPSLPSAPLRYLTAFIIAPLLAFWLIMAYGVGVLVAHDPYIGITAIAAKRLARLFGRRVGVVIETRGDLEKGLFMQREVPFKPVVRRLMHWLASFTTRRADVLRGVSQSSLEQLQMLAPDKPAMRFMSWTDSAAFSEVVAQTPVSQRHEIVYIGVLVPRKGIHHLLSALAQVRAQLPQVQLRIIGSASNTDYADQLRIQVADLGLSDCVTFVGHSTQDELAQYLAQARVMALPTYSEGMPKVVIESMLAGTPVLATAVDGIPEVVTDGVHGYLVSPGDVQALADRLVDLFTVADVDTMGQTAREFATAYYSPAAYVQQYGQLFRLAYDEAQR